MASKHAYAIACIELFTRLWTELDLLVASERRPAEPGATPAVAEQCEILRLELNLLLEACESARWRTLLTASQRLALKSMLQNVLQGLDFTHEGNPASALEWLQDRLLDAVLEQCAPELTVVAAESARRAAS